MNKKLISIAVASALTLAIAAPAQAAKAKAAPAPVVVKPATVSADDFNALKAQFEALQARLAQIEQQQQTTAATAADASKTATAAQAATTDLQDSIDRTSDNVARTAANVGEWVGRFQWKGDLRYRNESIDQQYIEGVRNRDRIRLRAGFFARVNDTVRVEMQMTTTEGGDPRSSNQTLTDTNSRKALDLDTAYAEWQPNAMWKVTLGKMRYPWVRPGQSMLFDGDINPEGIAVNYTNPTPGGLFASAFVTQLAERGAGAALIGQTNLSDSNMVGAQVGWRSNPALPTKFMVGASYYAYGAVKGYNALFGGSAFGNTTSTSTSVCRKGIATCLASDFSVVQVMGEFATVAGGYPLTAYVDYMQNSDAVTTYDTAYSVGFQYGRASNPRTWEFGAGYQKVEKDSQFGQYVDSDFGAGNTDSDGLFLKFGYQLARNWRVNGTYFINQTNNDVGTAITGVGTVLNRDYNRLQLDLNMTF